MARLLRRPARGRTPWDALAATLGLVLACSSSPKTFFGGPPVARGGAGSGATGAAGSGGGAGMGGTSGASGKGTGGDGAGGSVGDVGGAPNETGGAGGTVGSGGTGGDLGASGEPGSGGTGASAGSGATGGGGGGAGGSSAQGGAGATGASGGAGGTGGDAMAGTGGSAVGGAGAGGQGGSAGSALGGLGGSGGAAAGMGGKGGSSCQPTTPADEICDGVDNDCDDTVDGPGVCPAGCVGAVYGGHRYLLCNAVGNDSNTRQDAHLWCADDYTHALGVTFDLVRIDDEAENDFLLAWIQKNDETAPIWIAASDATQISDQGEGYWVWGPHDKAKLFWVKGSPVSGAFTYWGAGQPDDGGSGASEDCAVFDPDLDWHWNDRGCSTTTTVLLCEELD